MKTKRVIGFFILASFFSFAAPQAHDYPDEVDYDYSVTYRCYGLEYVEHNGVRDLQFTPKGELKKFVFPAYGLDEIGQTDSEDPPLLLRAITILQSQESCPGGIVLPISANE